MVNNEVMLGFFGGLVCGILVGTVIFCLAICMVMVADDVGGD